MGARSRESDPGRRIPRSAWKGPSAVAAAAGAVSLLRPGVPAGNGPVRLRRHGSITGLDPGPGWRPFHRARAGGEDPDRPGMGSASRHARNELPTAPRTGISTVHAAVAATGLWTRRLIR